MIERIRTLRSLMVKHYLDAVLISSPENIGYFSEQFIFSPNEREALMLVTQDSTFFFTDSRFTGMLTLPKDYRFIETSARSGAYDHLHAIVDENKIKILGYEMTNLSVAEYKVLKKAVRKKSKLLATDNLFTEMRMIKDHDEIKKISHACELTDNAFRYIQSFIIPGVTEIELAERIDNFFKRNGADSAFPSIVAFGKNAAVPHHIPTAKKLKVSDHYILFDLGARYKQYCGDLSRTVFIGEISDEIRDQYNILHEAQKRALAVLNKKSILAKKIDLAAREYLKEHFFEVPHSVGHGIGLSVHEHPSVSPRSKIKMREGMVITVEPGVYIPERGGIRIEDTVLITNNGYKTLTKSSKDLYVIR